MIIKASAILDRDMISIIKMVKVTVPWQWLKVWDCPSKDIPRGPDETKGLLIYEENKKKG